MKWSANAHCCGVGHIGKWYGEITADQLREEIQAKMHDGWTAHGEEPSGRPGSRQWKYSYLLTTLNGGQHRRYQSILEEVGFKLIDTFANVSHGKPGPTIFVYGLDIATMKFPQQPVIGEPAAQIAAK